MATFDISVRSLCEDNDIEQALLGPAFLPELACHGERFSLCLFSRFSHISACLTVGTPRKTGRFKCLCHAQGSEKVA